MRDTECCCLDSVQVWDCTIGCCIVHFVWSFLFDPVWFWFVLFWFEHRIDLIDQRGGSGESDGNFGEFVLDSAVALKGKQVAEFDKDEAFFWFHFVLLVGCFGLLDRPDIREVVRRGRKMLSVMIRVFTD